MTELKDRYGHFIFKTLSASPTATPSLHLSLKSTYITTKAKRMYGPSEKWRKNKNRFISTTSLLKHFHRSNLRGGLNFRRKQLRCRFWVLEMLMAERYCLGCWYWGSIHGGNSMRVTRNFQP